MSGVTGPGNWIRDSTDYPATQLVIGAAFGYMAGVTDAPEEKIAIAATLLAYRIVHHMGFFEINMRRSTKDKVQEQGESRKHNTSIIHTLGDFAKENTVTLGGFVTGYILANIDDVTSAAAPHSAPEANPPSVG